MMKYICGLILLLSGALHVHTIDQQKQILADNQEKVEAQKDLEWSQKLDAQRINYESQLDLINQELQIEKQENAKLLVQNGQLKLNVDQLTVQVKSLNAELEMRMSELDQLQDSLSRAVDENARLRVNSEFTYVKLDDAKSNQLKPTKNRPFFDIENSFLNRVINVFIIPLSIIGLALIAAFVTGIKEMLSKTKHRFRFH